MERQDGCPVQEDLAMTKPLDYEVWHDPNRIEGGPWVDVRKKLPDPQFEVILASIAGQYAVGRIFSSVVTGGLFSALILMTRNLDAEKLLTPLSEGYVHPKCCWPIKTPKFG